MVTCPACKLQVQPSARSWARKGYFAEPRWCPTPGCDVDLVGRGLAQLPKLERPHREKSIRARVMEWLNDQPGIYAWVTPTAFAHVGQKLVAGPGGFGFGLRLQEGKGVMLGTRGQQDVIACVDGWMLCIETKTPSRKQSEAQRRFQARIEAAGGVYVVARSVEEVREVVEQMRQRRAG